MRQRTSSQHRTTVLAVLGILVACADGPTASRSSTPSPANVGASAGSGTPLEGLLYGCSFEPSEKERLTNGGILHLWGTSNRNQIVTGNPLVDGFETNSGVLSIDTETGHGVANTHMTIVPTSVDGTWDVHLHVDFPSGTANVVGHGTGALQGRMITFVVTPVPGVPNACNPSHPLVAEIRGIVR